MPQKIDLQPFEKAVAYLLDNPESRPDGTQRLFEKLEAVEKSAVSIEDALTETRNSLTQLSQQKMKVIGSMDAILDLLKDDLSDEDVMKFASSLKKKVDDEVPEKAPA